MSFPLISLRIQYEEDVVAARQRTREMAEILGFDTQQQTRLATAVSEIARNAYSYAGGGKAEFFLECNTAPQSFSIRIADEGRGIPNLDQILAGTYRSETGMGLGIIGTQRLMDQFQIDSVIGKGTVVVLGKVLPPRIPLVTAKSLPGLLERILQQKPKTVLDAFREQNQELLRTMDELRRRQDELTALNRELEDTNSGVVALYAELDDKANHLRRADEMKSRFLFNMSHEFRTPLNSIHALSRMLLDRTDGELTAEQEIQVSFISKSAESLSDLVNDLLDIAKVEAGKVDVRPADFEAASLFGALRGMLKPLLAGNSVNLIFDDASGIPPIHSDEVRVSQILRNFISNSLKFTEAGEVRVSAQYEERSEFVRFDVRDTGIGIAPEHQEQVFEEFTQLDHYLQRGVKGTGLGLPLSRKLAELLGGQVSLQSQPGTGSTFSLRIPRVFPHGKAVPASAAEVTADMLQPASGEMLREAPQQVTRRKTHTVLLVDDDESARYLAKQLFTGELRFTEAQDGAEALKMMRAERPDLVVMDLSMPGMNGFEAIKAMQADAGLRPIPVVVSTSATLAAAEADYLATRAIAILQKTKLLKPESRMILAAALSLAGLEDLDALKGPREVPGGKI